MEVGEGKTVQMLQHLQSESQVDAVRGIGEEEGPDGSQRGSEDRADDEQSSQHIQRAQALLDDDLVDDHLDDHRIGQCEDLDEERGHDHLEEGAGVLPNVGEEGAESEGFTLRGAGTAGQQDGVSLLAGFGEILPGRPLLLIRLLSGHRVRNQETVRGDCLHDDRDIS